MWVFGDVWILHISFVTNRFPDLLLIVKAGEPFEAAQVRNIKLMPDQGKVFIKQFLQARLMMKHIYQ